MTNEPDHSDHKERLIDAAMKIVTADGIEALTAGKLATAVGLRRTVIHYHFGTMDDLLAAIVRKSFAQLRQQIRSRFDLSTLGEDIWTQYSISMPVAEEFRARALASQVVRGAYHEAGEALRTMLAEMLQEAYDLRRMEPEIPTGVMAMVMLMAAQFAGSQRALGGTDDVAALEAYMKSLFAITAGASPVEATGPKSLAADLPTAAENLSP